MEEEIQLVPVDSIKPAWLNLSRYNAEEIEMLAADIRAGGIDRIDPILVRRLPPEEAKPPAIYEAVDGYKRLEAAKRPGLPAVKAKVIEADREEALELNYRKNKEGGEIDEVLEAFYFLHLSEDLKMPTYQIAERFGMKEPAAASIIGRAKLTKEARRIIWRDAGGKAFTRRHLEALSSAPPEVQAKLAAIIYERRLSPSEAERAKQLLAGGASEEEAAAQAKVGARLEEQARAIVGPGKKRAKKPRAQGAGKKPAEAAAGRVEASRCPRCGIEVDWTKGL